MSVIELEQISKRYGGLQALNNLSLKVEPGEVVAFLGPNGAGKTTAISIMLGLKNPSSGSAKLFGQHPESAGVRSRVGVMLQESGVPQALKVKEVIELFQSYYPYTLPLDEILQRADLAQKANAPVAALSGGQKQRLYFALSIVGDPDLIFLDEPTVAMDVESRRGFWEQVRGFAALGKTILFSTHYLDEADAVASRIVVIHQGKVIADGSPSSIKQLVAAKTIRLKTNLTAEQAKAYPGVERTEQQNGHLVLYSNTPERFLQHLFQQGHQVSDLTVSDTDLEAAFVSLTA